MSAPRVIDATPIDPTHVAHLEPALWAKVNRLLIRKAIAELSHEKLIAPRGAGGDGGAAWYSLEADAGGIAYSFRARRLALDHWSVEAASIQKYVAGTSAPLEAVAFFVEFRDALGIAEGMLPIYLDEIAGTLYGSAFKHA